MSYNLFFINVAEHIQHLQKHAVTVLITYYNTIIHFIETRLQNVQLAQQ